MAKKKKKQVRNVFMVDIGSLPKTEAIRCLCIQQAIISSITTRGVDDADKRL